MSSRNEPDAFGGTQPSTGGDVASLGEPSTSSGGSWFDRLPAAPVQPTPAFDVCHVGVVLRAVLAVHAVLALGVAFEAHDLRRWVAALATGSVIALPGTLTWLLLACASRRWMAGRSAGVQWGFMILLGAVCGGFGWALLSSAGMTLGEPLHWAPPMLAGAALAAVMFQWLRLRAQLSQPAEATARLVELQSRIRPHFLFNTLNTAMALVRVDPPRAEDVLADLAELFRVALMPAEQSVSLREEIDLAQRYLAIEQVRFGARLKVRWELDTAADVARVPPLVLQPLIENAVRHGVEPSGEGAMIRIRTRVKRGYAVIGIVNTVSAVSRPGHGIALRNVRERVLLMHDVAGQFDARREGDLFKVQIIVPL